MMIPVAYVVVVLLAIMETTEGAIGMTWGRVTAQRLLPTQVVDLMLQNGIQHARIYSSEMDILKAFAGSGINLTTSISNGTVFADSYDLAKAWVQWKGHHLTRSNARRIILGESVVQKGLKDIQYLHNAIKCMQNVQHALNEMGYGEIKTTLQTFFGALKRYTKKPSEAEFAVEIKEEMTTVVRILQANNAPFAIQMFPISDTTWNGFDPSFAFPDNKSTQVVTDVNGAVYTNMFEYTFDSFAWALKKIGASDIQIVVSQVGWPTDGYLGANATAAERFYKGLLPLVASEKGTPMRHGQPIDVFLHSLADENKMPFYDSYPYTRHWGIYRSNGIPKYKIDLSGQGRDIYPTEVKGIQRMPQRWCVFNGNRTDIENVQRQYDFACEKADCTPMWPGGSCSRLSSDLNISYAFNMCFQFSFQDESVCSFEGLGSVQVEDPSIDGCVFSVEVVKGQQNNYVNMTITSSGKLLHQSLNAAILLAFLVSIFLMDMCNSVAKLQ